MTTDKAVALAKKAWAGFADHDFVAVAFKEQAKPFAKFAELLRQQIIEELAQRSGVIPKQPRGFFCTKCHGTEPAESIELDYPICKCGYQGIARNSGYTREQMNEAIASLEARNQQLLQMLSEQDFEYNRKTNALIARHAEKMEQSEERVRELEKDAAFAKWLLAAGPNESMNVMDCYDDWDGNDDFSVFARQVFDAAINKESGE